MAETSAEIYLTVPLLVGPAGEEQVVGWRTLPPRQPSLAAKAEDVAVDERVATLSVAQLPIKTVEGSTEAEIPLSALAANSIEVHCDPVRLAQTWTTPEVVRMVTPLIEKAEAAVQ